MQQALRRMKATLPPLFSCLSNGDPTRLLHPAKPASADPAQSSTHESQDAIVTKDVASLLSLMNYSHRAPKENADFGNYRILQSLGSGGFGDVWLAEQQKPMKREVALKAIRQGVVTRVTRQRFEREKQALAIMEHENIAKIYEASTSEDTYFFAMEYVRGLSITQHARTKNLTLHQRIELFIPVCRAVHHAHQKLVLHRDLKPANILVTEHDGAAVPKLIDFGIAKPLSDLHCLAASDEDDDMPVTLPGYCLGTPQYMSPEQAMGLTDLGAASDIYALGIILYELLVGEPPLTKADLAGLAPHEQMDRVINHEATPPSTLWLGATTANQKRCFDHTMGGCPRRMSHLLRGDLDSIVQKALEKDRAHRYSSAEALADDLAAYLSGKPISVDSPTRVHRWRSQIMRHSFAILTSSLVLFALLCCSFAFDQWQRAEAACAQARIAQAQTAQAQAAGFANLMFVELDQPVPSTRLEGQQQQAGAKPAAHLPLRTLSSIKSLDGWEPPEPAPGITLAGK